MFLRHTEGKNLLNASEIGFRANHSTTLQCMKLTDNVTLNFNNNMSTTVDIEKAFDTLWHPGLLYKLSTMEFSTNLMRLIGSFFSQRKFSLGGRRNVYAKTYKSRGATRFRPVPHTVQLVHK
jgi:hypothetical protein